ncbi:sensor histidine kinase [Plantibacter sp. Mn2098]|uniref:sensor histidine kinase n=1 Tax=Plantibacter sp. Mn2098 TaxID=3395266 RepID=UPI003BBAAD43
MRESTRTEPSDRRPTVRVWAVLAALAVILASVSIPVNSVIYGVPVVIAFVFGLLQAASIPLAAVRPKLAVATSLVSFVSLPVLSIGVTGAPWPVAVTSILGQIAVIVVLAFFSTWRVATGAWFLSVASVIAVVGFTPERFGRFEESLASAVPFTAISAGLLSIALLLAQRTRIRAQLERERRVTAAEQVRRELMEERNRIARELHDVVAHGLSVIQVQASSAKYRMPELDAAAAAEFDGIGATARGALSEMRQLLGVLRNEDASPGLGPQPGLADIPALVESMASSGVSVSLQWSVSDGDAPPPASVGLAAYRIVQESLSNAVRHAPGAPALVVVTRSAAAVDIVVENDASRDQTKPTEAAARVGGHGLVGMRERVLLVNGRLEHGPTEAGGFLVSAHLPVPATSEAP